ncbi:OmpA family protein [Vibrio parahaemolyticus]|nr:OmpA family protein [Vibrio parahaemolyticus]EJC7038624.1 OmpA family protein [Vibrio parahaemolyticus]ELA8156584.1 OmpA family protein [Vibrio parahaemolyticus]
MYASKSLFSSILIYLLKVSCSSAASLSIPGASIPGGYDRVTTMDGITCESTIASDAYLQAGIMGVAQGNDYEKSTNSASQYSGRSHLEDRDEVGAYIQIVLPLSMGDRERVNCNRLYNLEINRLKAEIEKIEETSNLNDIWLQDESLSREVITIDDKKGYSLFTEDDDSISLAYTYKLDEIIDKLKKFSESVVTIISHLDSKGNETKEIEQSRERARLVERYFESRGVDKTRIKVLAKGSLYPLEPNDTEEGRNANRRIEFIIEPME